MPEGEPTDDGPQITPWFTGTLLSTRGSSLGKGHAVRESYVYYTQYGGLYNDNWRLQSATTSRNLTQQTYFIFGLTDSLDIELAPQWIGSHARGDSSGSFGDLPLQLGVQAWRSPAQSWVPDIRLWVQEIVPPAAIPSSARRRRTWNGPGVAPTRPRSASLVKRQFPSAESMYCGTGSTPRTASTRRSLSGDLTRTAKASAQQAG